MFATQCHRNQNEIKRNSCIQFCAKICVLFIHIFTWNSSKVVPLRKHIVCKDKCVNIFAIHNLSVNIAIYLIITLLILHARWNARNHVSFKKFKLVLTSEFSLNILPFIYFSPFFIIPTLKTPGLNPCRIFLSRKRKI